MQILFLISALCFAGILWAALALARHIKTSRRHSAATTPSPTSFKDHLLAATETTPIHQSVHDITANKQWTLPPQPNRRQRLPLQRAEPTREARKSPQPARHGPMELLDPAYF